jgi:hypothetical protein
MQTTHENVRTTRNRMSEGQRRELATAISKVLPEDMSADIAQKWIGDGTSLKKVIYEALMPPLFTGDPLVDWKSLYKKCFGFDVDFTGLKIPPKKDGFDRLIIVAKGISPNRAYKACEKLFTCYRYTDDLNGATEGRNEREANQNYAIWVRDRQEADTENKSISADRLKERGGTHITLVERMLYEMKYFLETGEHMDTNETYTMCAGSRRSVGDVPYVCWDRGFDKMSVDWYGRGRSGSRVRARSVVS